MQRSRTRRRIVSESSEESADDMRTEILLAPEMTGSASDLPRHLLIISRYHPGLFEYVRTRFAREDNVEVVLDRRRGRDRRAAAAEAGVERRSSDRRVRPQIDAALRMESMQFVTVPPGAAPRSANAGEGRRS